MPDHRFFKPAPARKLDELAAMTGASLAADSDPSLMISDVASLDQAGPGQISFFDNIRYKQAFQATRAAACIAAPEWEAQAPKGVALLLTPQPYKTYARIAQAFYPETRPAAGVSERAVVMEGAVIGVGCTIEAGAVIGAGATIGPDSWIGANAVIGENVAIGGHCRIGAGAVISHSVIGDYVRIYPGCCIGQDGFGFAMDPAGHVKVPQLGRVIIENHVEIGANTAIDRGAGPDTVIGQGTWIDNLVQIGHNVQIGKGCVIVAQVGISGSTVVEDYAVLAGQAGVAGHLRIGRGARIAAQSGVMRDVPPGEEQMGYPAVPLRQFMKQTALVGRLAKPKKS